MSQLYQTGIIESSGIYTNMDVLKFSQNGRTGRMHDLGNRIRIFRLKAGMTREELADKLNVTSTTIYRKESGDRGIGAEEINEYAQALGCTKEQLISDNLNNMVPVLGYIGGGEQVFFKNNSPYINFITLRDIQMQDCELVDLPADETHKTLRAWRVKKEWEGPFLRDGDLVLTPSIVTDNFDAFIGFEVIVGTKDGKAYLKTLERGFEPGRYNLMGYNVRMIKDADLEWCAVIIRVIKKFPTAI